MTNRHGQRFLGIVQATMTAQTFERYSFVDFDGDNELVDCRVLAARQRVVLGDALQQVIERLRADEIAKQ